jgi:hypothetical protein
MQPPDPRGRMLSLGKVNAIGFVPVGKFGITLFSHSNEHRFLAGVVAMREERGVGLSLVPAGTVPGASTRS